MNCSIPFVRSIGVLLLGLSLCGASRAAAADVVAVVSVKSPVTTLSKNEIVDIFLGKESHFPNDSQAVPIDQFEGSAARDQFYLDFAGKSPAQLKAYWSKIIFTGRGQPPREAADSKELKKLIAENPGAIGYIDRSMLDSSLRVVQPQ